MPGIRVKCCKTEGWSEKEHAGVGREVWSGKFSALRTEKSNESQFPKSANQ